MPNRLPVLSIPLAFLAAMLVAMPAFATGLLVRFEHPGQFTDARSGAHGTTDARVMRIVEQHLHGLAQRCLPPAASLDIRVTDIDLAGRSDGMRAAGASAVRVMSETTWPKIDVSYVLARDGKEAVEVREQISDMNYLRNAARARFDSQPLPYERAMLTDWFEGRFCRS